LPIGLSVIASQKHWGVLNAISLPILPKIIIGVITLDLVLYIQHVAFHRFRILWRFHMVHHVDMDIDVTTGLRFHPIEAVLSMIIKLGAMVVIGPPPLAVLIFEILLNGASMFNHSNLKIPIAVDRILRLFIVTPDMHRVHHSVLIKEMDSNFGFSNISWGDRLFGTYTPQPVHGHTEMKIGPGQFRDHGTATIPRMLKLPFTEDARRNADIINRQRKRT
jgi:sterol desaturase/sphingolipid hydroxylase (fatty acid hydroxylase superfamily)